MRNIYLVINNSEIKMWYLQFSWRDLAANNTLRSILRDPYEVRVQYPHVYEWI